MLDFIAHFSFSVFFINGLPHYLHGLIGKRFPTPFANPPGKGESSPVTNILWAAINFSVAALIVYVTPEFALINLVKGVALASGGLFTSAFLATYFGKIYGRR